jgi:hypothetical protein
MAVVWASPHPPPGVPPLLWSSPFPFISVSLPVGCRYRSTHHPPHGQLLMGLGVGCVSFIALGGAGPVSVVWCGVDAGCGVSVGDVQSLADTQGVTRTSSNTR